MIPLVDESWSSDYLRADGSEPVYYVKIIKSEGTTDPDGGPGVWPGTGDAQTERWYTTGQPSWTDTVSMVSSGQLDITRMNGESISNVVFSVDASRDPGGIASVPSFKFSLDATDKYYGQLEEDGIHFEGRRCELWVTFKGETSRAGDVRKFTGYVTDMRIRGDSLEITVEGRESRRDSEMPPNVFEEETDAWETLIPQRTLGDAVPLVFGSHDMAQGKLVTDVKDDGTDDRGRAYRFVDTSVGLEIVGITNFRFGDSGLVDASGGFAEIKTAAVESLTDTTTFTVDSTNGEAYFDEVSPEKLYLYADIRPKAAVHHAYHRDAVEPENALDGDEATSSTLSFTNTAGLYYGTYKIPAMGLAGDIEQDGTDTGIFALMRVALSIPAGSEGWFQAFVGAIEASGGTNLSSDKPGINIAYEATGTWDWYSPPDPDAAIQLGYFGATWSDWSTLQALGQYFFHLALYNPSGGSSYTMEYELFELMIRVYFSLSFPDEGFYADVDGYADDASGTYTGSASGLIENPAHLAAVILDLFSSSADVDTTAHKAVASGYRSGWKFANNIVEAKSVDEYLQELCTEALLFSWVDEDGVSKVFPMTAPEFGPDFVLKQTDVRDGQLDQPERTRLENVITDFVIQYKYNDVRDGFDGQLVCNPTESSSELGSDYQSICAWAKYNAGGVTKKKTIELEWVRDRDTAVEVAKKLIVWHSSRRWVLKWTSDLALLQVQLGDSFTIDPTWLTDEPDSLRFATYRVTKVTMNPKTDTIAVEAVQVFE